MSAKVNIVTVEVLKNKTPFKDDISLEITFEAYENLKEDLDWKVTYVGSPEDNSHDQELESIAVGPIPEGRHKFVLDAPAPDIAKIPSDDLLGVTVMLLSCEYRGQEFINIGYYVSTEYENPEWNTPEGAPETLQPEKLIRNILADEPRVTHRTIKWTAEAESSSTNQLPASASSTNEQGGDAQSNAVLPPCTQGEDSCDIVIANGKGGAESAPLGDVTNGEPVPME